MAVVLQEVDQHHIGIGLVKPLDNGLNHSESSRASPIATVQQQVQNVGDFPIATENLRLEMDDSHHANDSSLIAGYKMPSLRVKQAIDRIKAWPAVEQKGDHSLLWASSSEINNAFVVRFFGWSE